MQRRQFLGTTLSVAAAAGTSLVGWAGPSAKVAFRQSLRERAWLQGFATVANDRLGAQARIIGTIPADLRGVLYRNGPAKHEIGSLRYRHWFDGDGMVQRFAIGERGVSHVGRMVLTEKYQSELTSGRAQYPGFDTEVAGANPVTEPDDVNTGNISVLHHGGRLFALWEAGSAWELDPKTLQTRGKHTFSAETAGAPFSAHPRQEPNGAVWNFGYSSQAGALVIWHLDANCRLKNVSVVPVKPMGMPHDFVVTERFIVIPIAPFHFQPDQTHGSFLERHRWNQHLPTRIVVIEKSDLRKHRWFELPAHWAFHFGNGWNDKNGVIHFDGAVAKQPDTMTDFGRQVMLGLTPSQQVPNVHMRFTLDTRSGRAHWQPLVDRYLDSEFPVIDPRVVGKRNRRLVLLRREPSQHHPLFTHVTALDTVREHLDEYQYPTHQIPEEHLFVPKPASTLESDGWLIGTALDYREQRTILNIFDAMRLSDGPVATAQLPYVIPFGFHGKFVATDVVHG
ncbi:MAG: carotenoid oxygenase family protein [Pseudomonadota bacterium]